MADNSTMSQSDVQSLAEKLANFSKTLTPGERMVLIERLKQPESDGDVQGFMNDYMVMQLAEAHRQELLHEAEQQRLASSPTQQRPGIGMLIVGTTGAALVGIGTWMKQVAQHSARPAARTS